MQIVLKRCRIVSLLATGTALTLGVAVGVRLAAYGVPAALIASCALGVAASSLTLFSRLSDAAATTTHRCPAVGCAFAVTIRGVEAEEGRRWRQIAAAHPTHRA